MRGIPEAGERLTCTPGTWSGAPAFTYLFIDSKSGQTLQSGSSSTYTLTSEDVGRTIFCQLQASNEGGTAVVRTGALPAVQAPVPFGAGTPLLLEHAEAEAREAAEKKAREEAERAPPHIATLYQSPEPTVTQSGLVPHRRGPGRNPTGSERQTDDCARLVVVDRVSLWCL